MKGWVIPYWAVTRQLVVSKYMEKAESQRSHSGVTWEELHGCVYYISMVILWRAVLHKVKTPKQ